jgi:hypothetical protein
MITNVLEKVFIAWCNSPELANDVSARLHALNFNGIVGGGSVTANYVGQQIVMQMQQCTRAIILIKGDGKEIAKNGLNDNLMFEWGYLTARINNPSKIHVFLIDISKDSLPSDLSGIWVDEIKTGSKDLADAADEITEIFKVKSLKEGHTDKFQMIHDYGNLKQYLATYESLPLKSDLELSHLLLHNIETCYYYMEENILESILDNIQPSSEVLRFVIKLAKSNFTLFRETNGLTRHLSFETFLQVKTEIERPFDFSNLDENLNDWINYFNFNRLALLYKMLAANPEMEEEKALYIEKAMQLQSKVHTILDAIREKFTEDKAYTDLYGGYLNRDYYREYMELGDVEKAIDFAKSSAYAFQSFKSEYESHFPRDVYVIKQYEQEYYLSLIEYLKYIDDPIEKKVMEKSIRDFLAKRENEAGRQHSVLNQLKAKFNG